MGGMSCSSEFPQRKTRGTTVAEKFLGYVFLLFQWPEATEVGQTAKGEAFTKPIVISLFHPHPLLPPPAISAFLSLLPYFLGQTEFGKKLVAAATAAAERVLACSRRWV